MKKICVQVHPKTNAQMPLLGLAFNYKAENKNDPK